MAATFKLTLACAGALLISACASPYGANPYAANQNEYAANPYASGYPSFQMNMSSLNSNPVESDTSDLNIANQPYPEDRNAYEDGNGRNAPDDRYNEGAADNQTYNDQSYDDRTYDDNDQDDRDLPTFPDSRVSVEQEGNGMRVGLPGEILFSRDSASLYGNARDLISVVVANLKDRYRDMDIAVNGYTDTAGTYGHNLDLSEERALAVADELVSQGIDPSRIRTFGHGEQDLRVETRDGVRESRNRRVEIVLRPSRG
jgi:outer membrane protein OmpA-like peptidoglycan-associated protein